MSLPWSRYRRSSPARVLVVGFLCCLASMAAAADDTGTNTTTDYRRPASWACRPGADNACTSGLDAIVVTADGRRIVQPFHAATDPPLDCFYVYPTVSREDRPYSDLAADAEVMGVIRTQAGRLASRCRLFAPLYRQATLAHLRDRMSGSSATDSDVPFEDVAAAWSQYLTQDNQGRGVVFVGHSQGAILLQRLIAERIDGHPAQRLLVAAFLAGDPSLGVPPGKTVGGTLAHVSACTAATQIGCVYAWGSYRDDDDAHPRAFGRPRRDGLVSVCSNPAAPGGGRGALKSYVPPIDPGAVDAASWQEIIGQLSASCRTDAEGEALRVTVEPGPDAAALASLLRRAEHRPRWGLHTLDMALYLGNIVDLIEIESGVWAARDR